MIDELNMSHGQDHLCRLYSFLDMIRQAPVALQGLGVSFSAVHYRSF